MLAELQELKRQQARKEELRDEIMFMLEEGAEIEVGPLQVEIRELEQRTISYAALSQVVGEAEAAAIKSRIEPTARRHLIVIAPDSGGGRQRQPSRSSYQSGGQAGSWF
jgi:hypothetical protein